MDCKYIAGTEGSTHPVLVLLDVTQAGIEDGPLGLEGGGAKGDGLGMGCWVCLSW